MMLSSKIGQRLFCSVSELVGRTSPCLMISPSFGGGGEGEMRYNFFSLVHDDVVSFGNKGGKEKVDLMKDERTKWAGWSHGWLALFNSLSGDMFLLNPVSDRHIPLPPCKSESKSDFSLKMILSHSPDNDIEECRALMIRGSNTVAYCHPGHSRDWATLFHCRPNCVYGDFVYSAVRKTFLGSVRDTTELCRTEFVDVWEHPSMGMSEREVRAPRGDQSDPGFEWQTFLVSEEESGQLYMVRRYAVDRDTIDYLVYKINDDHGAVEVELCSSLDDIIMIVGNNHSFAVKASRFPQLLPNSIYFSEIWIFHRDQVVDAFDYNNKGYAPFSDLPITTMFPSSQSVLLWFSLILTPDLADE